MPANPYSYKPEPMEYGVSGSTSYGAPYPAPAKPGMGQMAAPAARAASSFIPGANLALNAVGTLAGLYGAYKSGEQAEEAAKEAKRRYEEERALQAEEIKKRDAQQQFANMMSTANYGGDLSNRIASQYGEYFARTGG